MIRPLLLAAFALSSLAACAGDLDVKAPREPDLSQDADMSADMDVEDSAVEVDLGEDACAAICQRLSACGAHKADTDCEALCAMISERSPIYGAPNACQRCVAMGCDVAAACLADPSGPCGRPPAQLNVLVRGDFSPGRATHATLRLWDGTPVAQTITPIIPEGNAQLNFGDHAIHPGILYLVDYFIDVDDDGTCEPSADALGGLPIMLTSDAIFGFQTIDHASAPNTSSCELFPSRAQSCERRCQLGRACGDADAEAGCELRCLMLSPLAAAQCDYCLDAQPDCDAQTSQCRGQMQPCQADFTPPDATLITTGIGIYTPDEEGLLVRGLVRSAELNRRVTTEREVAVTDQGRFVLNFGMSVWRGRDYVIQHYLDRDGDGRCSPGEQAYSLSLSFSPNSITVIQNATPEQLTPISCADYDAP